MLKTKPRPKKAKPKKPTAKPAPRVEKPGEWNHSPTVELFFRAYQTLSPEDREDLFIRLANEPEQYENVVDIAHFLTRDPNEPTRPYEEIRKELGLAS